MGKASGFMDYKRVENTCENPVERIKHFNEFHPPLTLKERKLQGARCMNCGVPFCQSAIELQGMVTGCPLHNLIPEWNDEIYQGNTNDGLERLLKTSCFPEFTGRVCPALCEKACIAGMQDGNSVTIRENELFLIEEGFKNGRMKPSIPKVRTGKKVAVVGSGPAGLAVAHELNKRGHQVCVYERDDRAGGLLMYGIPNMKLEKQIIKRRIALMEAEGISFIYNANVGKNIQVEELEKEYHAVVLCCGAKKARQLGLDTKGIEGVYMAVDFLSSTTKSLLEHDLLEGTYLSAKQKHIIVVGGGDTGNDCVGTSIRHGAQSVTQLEIMAKLPQTRSDTNPWPQWPKVSKTDYGQEEAKAVYGQDPRVYETTIKELITQENKLVAVKTVQVKFENGKLVECSNSEKTLAADMVLVAAGFLGTEEYIANAFGLTLDSRNNVVTQTKHQTQKENIFVAGDMNRGQSLVVWAMAEGKTCAKEVEKYLMQ